MKKRIFMFILAATMIIMHNTNGNSIPFRIFCGATALLFIVDIILTVKETKHGNTEA